MTDREELELCKKELEVYKQPGMVGLYYSLQRKANELKTLLDKYNLSELELDDKTLAGFERVMTLFKSAGDLSDTMKKLKQDHGLSGNEEQDTKRNMPILESWAMAKDKKK